MNNSTEPTTEQTSEQPKKPERKRLSSIKSTFNPSLPPTAPVVQPQEPQTTADQPAEPIEKAAEIPIQNQQPEIAAPEQKVNTAKPQKVINAKETKEEKATEKMSIYLTPTERRQYRALMRQYEDASELRLDENKFFRIVLKEINLEVLRPPKPE